MSRMKIDHGAWVVVCDGAKALLFENLGDEVFPNLRAREVYAHQDANTHDTGIDARRAFNSVRKTRSVAEQADWHDDAERHFLVRLAERLDAAVARGEAKSMVIVAAPRALGVLRQIYSPALRGAICAELDKDFVRLPVYEIEKHLAG